MVHPIDLPEITEVIASSLTKISLFQCIQVSHVWHAAFLPYLWKSICIQAGDNHPVHKDACEDQGDDSCNKIKDDYASASASANDGEEDPPPRSLEALTRFSHLVQELSMNGTGDATFDIRVLSLPFPHLHTFDLIVLKEDGTWNTSILTAAKALAYRQAHLLRSITLTSAQSRVDNKSTDTTVTQSPWNTVIGAVAAATSTSTHIGPTNRSQQQQPQQQEQLRSRLRSLSLSHIALCPQDLEQEGTRELLIGLETLALKTTVLHRNDRSDQELPLWRLEGTRIRHLELASCEHEFPSDHVETEYALLLDCQEIRSLNWRRYWPQEQRPLLWQQNDGETGEQVKIINVLGLFPQDLRRGCWPFLERLDLQCTEIPDRALAEILASLGRPLRSLNAVSTGFGPLSARALLGQPFEQDPSRMSGAVSGTWTGPKHALALEFLNFHACHYVTSAMVQEFLCSFPKLREFRARLLKEEDVVADPRPWVCKEIKTLELHFAMLALDATDPAATVELVSPVPPMIAPAPLTTPGSILLLDRLAELTRLVEFSSGNHLYTTRNRNNLIIGEDGRFFPSLLFRLEGDNDQGRDDDSKNNCSGSSHHPDKGLDRLKTWRELRRLNLIDPAQHVSLSDAKWMVAHFPLLERVLTYRMSTINEQTEVQNYFKDHNVTHW